MFRLLGRLFRAWELYNFVRYFSPMGYAVDKLIEYIIGRMRTVDWVYVSASGLLLLVWVLELINWMVQAVLAILRATGAWHGVWPAWPGLAKLAHPEPGSIVEWLLCGVFMTWAALSWLVYFARRLWPAEQMAAMRRRIAQWREGQAAHAYGKPAHEHPGFDPAAPLGPRFPPDAAGPGGARVRLPRHGFAALLFAWVLQVLVLV